MAHPVPQADEWIGLHPNIGRAVYESIPAVNFSTLKLFAKTPAHVREAMIHPKAPTPAKDIGQLAHVAILEPARFEAEYVAAPDVDRRTKLGKETWAAFEAEQAGRTLVPPDEHACVRAWRDAVWSHPTAAALLSGAKHREVAVVWRHPRTGLLVKSLLDLISTFDGWTWIPDLKTTRDASPRAFANDIARFEYHAQTALYLNGCNAIAERPRRFAWICVEKERPHAVAVREPDEQMILVGESRYERWLDQFAECQASNVWSGYPATIEPVSLPAWADRE